MNETALNRRRFWIRVVAALIFFAFIYYVRDVLLPVVISGVLFYILNPLVSRLTDKRPKGLGFPIKISIVIAMLIAAVVIYLFFRFVIPPLAFEFKHFGQNIPSYIQSAKEGLNTVRDWYAGISLPVEAQDIITQSIQGLVDSMMAFGESTLRGILSVAGRFIQLILIPILTYYLLKDKNKIKAGLLELLPESHRKKTTRIISRINEVLNGYIRGMAILCFVIGIASTTGLYILGVKYFLVLGLIAGVTEAIPFVGPWIGSVPAIIVAFLSSPLLALQVMALYFLIQMTENSFLVPKVLGSQLSLHPVAIIIAILVLGKLIGAWGLFFAAPIVAILRIVYEEIQEG